MTAETDLVQRYAQAAHDRGGDLKTALHMMAARIVELEGDPARRTALRDAIAAVQAHHPKTGFGAVGERTAHDQAIVRAILTDLRTLADGAVSAR